MAAICAFLVVHVALAVLVPKSLRAMIIGRWSMIRKSGNRF
jgi:hypothetical protein